MIFLGLLIDPDGILKQRISSRPTARELENVMGAQASSPKWEKPPKGYCAAATGRGRRRCLAVIASSLSQNVGYPLASSIHCRS
jgi:hypothetical protein